MSTEKLVAANFCRFFTYVISLAHRQDRRDRILSQFERHDHTGYQIIDAVDGKSLPPNCHGLLPGEIGIWHSLLSAIDHAKRLPSGCHLHICEDDCLFSDAFFNSASEILDLMESSNVDIIFTDTWAGGKILEILPALPTPDSSKKIVALNASKAYNGRCTSFFVNQSSLSKIGNIFGDQVLKRGGPDQAVDTYLRDAIRSKEINGFVLYPFLTTIPFSGKSDIADTSNYSAAQKAWESFFDLSSRIPFIESNTSTVREELFAVLADLDLNQMKTVISRLPEALIKCGYIKKARGNMESKESAIGPSGD